MELVNKYIEKYASAQFNTCTDDALTHQFNDLMKQCEGQNDNTSKGSKKKAKKEKLANILCMLLKMKGIAEQKELLWYTEKAQLRGDVDKIEQDVSMAIASAENDSCEYEDLRDEMDNMVQQNCELEDKLEEYKERYKLREQRISLLEEREAKYEDVMAILRNQLHDTNVKLELKEQCIRSLKSQDGTRVNNHSCNQICSPDDQKERDWKRGEEQPVCTADSLEGNLDQSSSLFTPESGRNRQIRENLLINSSNQIQCTTLSIQEKTNLCQVLGKFDTSASAISLSNRLEAVVTQYNLGNRAACALLRVWLPSQLCEKLQPPVGSHKGLSVDLESNWGNASDRMKELKRVMGGRDTRGTNALENAKLNRGDDPIIFCSEYLTLYRSTYNCPDMSPDDSSFLYSMANKCTFVDYPTKVALRNANSYQAFVNILKDWIQDTSHDNKPQKRISEVVKNEGKVKFVGKCYKCGYTGHAMKDCRNGRKVNNNRPFIARKQKPETDSANNGGQSVPEVTLYGPLLEELRKIGKAMAEKPEELKTPPPTNPYVKQ
ncbi:posterior protein-like [Anomaloglossus baeobatrachus]|uniref:posterior protein-like n=1 Tax=Anomaloglossus baeobatrachus TaxID=238106 RepID=UPI003F50D3CF